MARRLWAVLLAAAIVAASAVAVPLGSVAASLKCDDSCSTLPGWREDPNAWQWEALGTLSIGGFFCALLFLIAVAARWRLVSLTLLVVWAALGFAFLTLFRDSGWTSHAGRGWAGLSVLVLAGLAAIGLSRRSSAEY